MASLSSFIATYLAGNSANKYKMTSFLLNNMRKFKKQRYRCKACKLTFTNLTNTVLYRIHRVNQWAKFIECMIEGYSLRKSAYLIGNITQVTMFCWRHKLFSSLIQAGISNFYGIVEMDETYFYTLKSTKKH